MPPAGPPLRLVAEPSSSGGGGADASGSSSSGDGSGGLLGSPAPAPAAPPAQARRPSPRRSFGNRDPFASSVDPTALLSATVVAVHDGSQPSPTMSDGSGVTMQELEMVEAAGASFVRRRSRPLLGGSLSLRVVGWAACLVAVLSGCLILLLTRSGSGAADSSAQCSCAAPTCSAFSGQQQVAAFLNALNTACDTTRVKHCTNVTPSTYRGAPHSIRLSLSCSRQFPCVLVLSSNMMVPKAVDLRMSNVRIERSASGVRLFSGNMCSVDQNCPPLVSVYGRLSCTRCEVHGGLSSASGGAVYNQGEFKCVNCGFFDNRAGQLSGAAAQEIGYGGAIFSAPESILNLENALFRNNSVGSGLAGCAPLGSGSCGPDCYCTLAKVCVGCQCRKYGRASYCP